jgi:integration host factor subunit beta
MTKTELIRAIAEKHPHFTLTESERVVNCLFEQMAQALASGKRIEIRGFGSFTLHKRPSRKARNPRTGETVALPVRYMPHFKAGHPLRDRLNALHEKPPITD